MVAKERVDLGRRERRRRLVEQQNRRFAREFAQQFDALLDADRQRLDDRVGIDVEPVLAPRARARARARAARSMRQPARGSRPSSTFSHTRRRSMSWKCWWTRPTGAVRFDRARVGRRPRRTQSPPASICRRRSRRRARGFRRRHVEVDAVDGQRSRRSVCGCRAGAAPPQPCAPSSSSSGTGLNCGELLARRGRLDRAGDDRGCESRRSARFARRHHVLGVCEGSVSPTPPLCRPKTSARWAACCATASARQPQHADVDALDHAGEHLARRERVLIGVDADHVVVRRVLT